MHRGHVLEVQREAGPAEIEAPVSQQRRGRGFEGRAYALGIHDPAHAVVAHTAPHALNVQYLLEPYALRAARDEGGGRKEDAMELYGFFTENELNCFRLLIGVSGVGPKAALSILSSSTPETLAMSIITGDEKALTVAPGIGKKIAQRVILELKDKLAKGQITPGGESYGGTGVTVIPENKSSEAAAALAVLGYSQAEISMALRGIDLDALSLEDIIKQALKKMMKG